MKRRALSLVLALAVLLQGGCASGPRFEPIPDGAPVTVRVLKDAQADGTIQIRNEALGSDTATGAGSGLLVGGLWGLSCGPFAVLCVPLGAAAGALTGTAAGAAVGVTGALPDDKAAALRDRLARVLQSHALLAELDRNVVERAGKYWRLGTDAAATAVDVELLDLQLMSTRDERVRCQLRVRVVVRPAADAAKPRAALANQKLYEYIGPYSSLAVWLDERNDFVDTSLTSASQQIAAQIVADLALH